MVLVSEIQHPSSLDFRNQKRVVVLRDQHGWSWEKIAEEVVNLKGETPSWKLCSRVYQRFSTKAGHVPYSYGKCGRKRVLTPALQKWLVARLLVLRKNIVCTASVLQRELARMKGVKVEVSSIRKVLKGRGFRWLPRAQKPKYSGPEMASRSAFAKRVVRMTPEQLREKLCLAMDGVVLSMPPKEETARWNHCHTGDANIWRQPGEAAQPELAGRDHYTKQVPIARAVPMWGGVSEGGFSIVVIHEQKKLSTPEWVRAVHAGKLKSAITDLQPVSRRGPWSVLCDNESFLTTDLSLTAYERCGVTLWQIPARSPDLNPVEKFWSWLRRRLRQLDLADLVAKRAPLGRTAWIRRMENVCKSQRACRVAAKCAGGLRKVCKEIIKKQGAASRG